MVFEYGPWGWDTATTTNATAYGGGTIVIRSGSGLSEDPPPPPTGPLAWLDERVDEIAAMGRELMEA